MAKLVKIIQFALIAIFVLIFIKYPENVAKPLSAIVLAVFFLTLFAESVMNQEAYLRLAVVKKSENKAKYYCVITFHLAVASGLLIYAVIKL